MNSKPILAAALIATALAAPAQAAKYKTVAVKNGGTITGKVSFTGKDPAPKDFAVTKNPEVCGSADRKIDFVKVNNGALEEAVVYIAKIKAGKAFPEKLTKPFKLDQHNCAFHPFLGAMANGQKLDVVNSDPVLHNIHTYEQIGRAKRTVFNVSQPDKGTIVKKVKLRRGTSMKIECDAHDFMHGFMFVAKNPYFAVVKDDGSYAIKDVPPGKYTLKVWHGTLGTKKTKITVAAGATATHDFTFKGK